MEESLERAGTARAAADTPDELLARAAGSGLVRTGAAARLTALFYEARFSSHPMPLAQRDEAQRALAELADSLRDLEHAGAGTAGTAGSADTAGGGGRGQGRWRRVSGSAAGPPRPVSGWRSAVPEICIAAATIAVAAVAGYAAAGLPGSVLAVTIGVVVALVVLRVLAPPPTPAHDVAQRPDTEAIPASFAGYWRKRAGLVDGTKSMTVYDAELRGTLQHLLAVRLAERHGISLHDDPAAARRLLCPGHRDDRLWYWVDPARPPTTPGRSPASRHERWPG